MIRHFRLLHGFPCLLLSTFVAFLLTGCAGTRSNPASTTTIPQADRPVTPKDWIRTELYFGGIAETPWSEFLAKAVTPRFPSGLTVLDATGQWRGRDGAIHHLPTRILVILHPGTPETDRLLESIRTEFREQFHHESVLRADSPARVTF